MAKTRLTLNLKKKWFDMIQSGEKTEEYRELNSYWGTRINNMIRESGRNTLMGFSNAYLCDELVFCLGYPRKDDHSKRIVVKNARVRIGEGKPQWGAKPGETYFIITWDVIYYKMKKIGKEYYE